MSVTDEDRERAKTFVNQVWWAGAVKAPSGPADDDLAQMLAAEREKARAPFRNLVAFYDRHEYSSIHVNDLRDLLDQP